jgi:hypothetical protein
MRARVTLVTCVWQRRALTRAFWFWLVWLRQYWRHQHGIVLEAVAAASDPLDADLASAFGVKVIRQENHPLGAKFNAALQAGAETDPDAVLIMGSDDFFCERVADYLADAVIRRESVGPKDLYFADLPGGQMRYWKGYRVKSRHKEPAGCGVLHLREFLESVHWTLWDSTVHHGMDHSRFRLLKERDAMPTLFSVKELDGFFIDVKTETNLWTYDRNRRYKSLPDDEMASLWARLPSSVLESIPFPVTV